MSISLEHFSFRILEKITERGGRRRGLRRETPPASIKYQSIEKGPPVSLLLEPTTICLHAVHTSIVLK